MKIFLILVVCASACASNSVIVTAGMSNPNAIPSVAAFSAVGSFRLEGQFDNYTSAGAITLFGTSSVGTNGALGNPFARLTFSGFCDSIDGAVQPAVLIDGTSLRWRAQRNLTSGLASIETWDENTGVYRVNTCTITTSGLQDIRGLVFSIGGQYTASIGAHIGMVRAHTALVTLGSAPPQRYRTSGYGDLFDFELEQTNGNQPVDSGPNSVVGNFGAGGPNYATTATLNPVGVLATTPPLTLKAGLGTPFDSSGSFANQDDPALTCAWTTVSSNPAGQAGTWTSPTSCSAATFTASNTAYFGTFNLLLTVTDAGSATGTKAVKIGSVITDANDVVQVSNANISQILGPLLRYGAPTAPWSWMDDRNKYTIDQQILIDQRCFVQPKAFAMTSGALSSHVSTTGTATGGDCTFTAGRHWFDYEIDATGTPDTFKWRVDGGTYTTGVAITGAAQTLSNGVSITFAATTGHSVGHAWQSRTSIGYWQDYWNQVAYPDSSSMGTVSITVGSAILTGVGTHFQTDFCGGIGSTAPMSETNQLALKYASVTYGGQVGSGVYQVASCDSQTQITLTGPYIHTAANQSGIQYAIVSNALSFGWTYTNTPGDYYDSLVLAPYSLYYRTGIDTYLGFARTIAQKKWESKSIDKGNSFHQGAPYYIPGYYSVAPRSVGMTGLVLWHLDTGADVWPGLREVAGYYESYMLTAAFTQGVGDLRELAYETQQLSLIALYDTDATSRAARGQFVSDVIDTIWVPFQSVNTAGFKVWPTPTTLYGTYYVDAGGGIYVTATTGSPNITLTGSTWAKEQFSDYAEMTVNTNGTAVTVTSACSVCIPLAVTTNPIAPTFVQIGASFYQIASVQSENGSFTLTASAGNQTGVTATILTKWLWMVTDKTNGNSTGPFGIYTSSVGDTTIYHIASITDSTHAVLDRNYAPADNCSGGCQRAMEVSHAPGLGVQPFMVGVAVGSLAQFVRPALLATGHTAQAASVLRMANDGAEYLSSSLAFDPVTRAMYYFAGNLNCRNGQANDQCVGALVLNGEANHAFSQAYLLSKSPTVRAAADNLFSYAWCKPTGGWTCPITAPGTYMFDIDSEVGSGGYMNNIYDVTTNKWPGFFFGYGYTSNWPAARLGPSAKAVVIDGKVNFSGKVKFQ